MAVNTMMRISFIYLIIIVFLGHNRKCIAAIPDFETCSMRQPVVLEIESTFDYFILPENSFDSNLVLTNYYSKVPVQFVLYLSDLEHFSGSIELKYFGKLKIVTKGNLHLDSVTFFNIAEVEISSGYEMNNKILPLVNNSISHVHLYNVVAAELRIHDISSLSLAGNIYACNAFELKNIGSIDSSMLTLLLSDEFEINHTNFIDWAGTVTGCRKFESKKISISAFYKINISRHGKIFSNIFKVKSCNFSQEKGSVIKAKKVKLVIDGNDCMKLFLSLDGIVNVLEATAIESSKENALLFIISSYMKTGSLNIDAESGILKCHGCRITVTGRVTNSNIKLSKLGITSEVGSKADIKILSALSSRQITSCYDPLLVSERCEVKKVDSRGENLLFTHSPYYIKIASIFIEGVLKLNIKEIAIDNAAFIVDGKLESQTQIDNLTIEATKGFQKIVLAPVLVDVATRSSSGTGKIIDDKPRYYYEHKNALEFFNKYNVARDFKLISQSEHTECMRSRDARDVYCPIYTEENHIIRNTDGLQSIFHANSYDGAIINGLSIGNDITVTKIDLISSNMLEEVNTADVNNQWSEEVARHKTLLKDTMTSLEDSYNTKNSEVQDTTSGDSKAVVLKKRRLSAEIALNPYNLGEYEVFSSARMQEFFKNTLPISSAVQSIWNILDYPNTVKEALQDDALLLKLFKCVKLELPIVNFANQELTQQSLNDLILATVGKLKGISSARLLEHLVDNTCSIVEKLEASFAKAGVPLNIHQKELFESPGVWPFWVTNCPGDHTKCITLELALNQQTIDKLLPSGAKLSADEQIILEGTHLKLGMNGNIVAGESIKAKLIGDTRIDGRMLANVIENHIDGNLKNVGIISGGLVSCTANNIINLGLIEATKSLTFQAVRDFIAAGFIESEGSLSLDVAHKLTLLSLKEIAILKTASLTEISESVAHVTSMIAKGTLEISAGHDILNIGAEIVGESVFISTSDKIITVPLELYNEVVSVGKYHYESYKGSKFIKAKLKTTGNKEESLGENLQLPQNANNATVPALIEKVIAKIKNKSGTVVINAKKEIQIIGSDITGAGDFALLSEESISVRSIKPWTETVITTRGNDLFSKWESTIYSYDEDVSITSNIETGGTLHSYSFKNQEYIGVSIKFISAKLAAGTASYKANIHMLPIQKTKIIEVRSKTRNFAIKVSANGVNFTQESRDNLRGTSLIESIPTIIEVEKEFLAYASGEFVYIDPAIIDRSEDERGNIHVKIKAEKINLEAAPEVESSYSYLDVHGRGLGFSVDGETFGIKSFLYDNSTNSRSNRVTYKTPKPLKGWIELDAKTVQDAGIVYHAQSLHINSDIEIHGVVMNEENEKDIRTLFEAGLKLGIKSNLGAIANSIESIAEGEHSRAEALISKAFQGYSLYVEILKLLSASHGLSGGIWFYANNHETEKNERRSRPVPTTINVLDLKSKSEELQLIGTQVSAYRAYIKAKYFKGAAAENEEEKSVDSNSFDLEVPIAGTVAPNIQGVLLKATEKSQFYLNTKIYVNDRLTLKIEGKADLKGVYVSAGKLEASFNELVLESLQNILEVDGTVNGLGLGINKDSLDISNLNNQITDRSRHVVDSLTALLGRESAHIVIAQALRINGALIANANCDENGEFTDHGHLTLKVGELFVQHIYDYDKGITLGAALSLGGKNEDGHSSINVMPTYGIFDKYGITRSTIGKGNFCVGSCKLSEDASGSEFITSSVVGEAEKNLNRDLEKTQEFTTGHNIMPITAYFTNTDLKKLIDKIPEDKVGDISFNNFVSHFFETILSHLNLNRHQAETKRVEPSVIDDSNENAEEKQNNKEEHIKMKDYLKKYIKAQKVVVEKDNNLDEKSKDAVNKLFDRVEELFIKFFEPQEIGTNTVDKTFGTKAIEKAGKIAHKILSEYADFSAAHPYSSEFGLSFLNILFQSIVAGPAGGFHSLKSEATGHVISTVAEDQLSENFKNAVDSCANELQNQFPGLSYDNAAALVSFSFLGSAVVTSGSGYAKTIFKKFNFKDMKKFDSKNHNVKMDFVNVGDTLPKIREFPKNDAQIKHIFRNARGHVSDTPENRRKILDTANNMKKYYAKDKHGCTYHADTLDDGRQVWARVRDDKIVNGGINDIPLSAEDMIAK